MGRFINKKIVYLDADEEDREFFTGERLQRLKNMGSYEIYYGRPQSVSEYTDRIGSAEAIILRWHLPLEALKSASNLKIVSCMGIDFAEFIDIYEAANLGVTVCNTPGYGDDAIAEHALALMLAASRNLINLDAHLRAGIWDQSFQGIQLRGKQIGIVGFGSIGQRFTSLVQSLGMNVLVWTRNKAAWQEQIPGIRFVTLEELLKNSDFISIHLALTPETRGLFGKQLFSKVKPGAILVNTSRGKLIDEDSLVTALNTGRLKAAGLDVYSKEPILQTHPLCRLPNVVLTPHVAFNTIEANRNLHDMAINNLLCYFQGNPINVVAHPEVR